MTRLEAELNRLYPAPTAGGVQTLVLELARPADWDALGPLWRGVQADLALPAPAIAVSGTDGLQLWFSLQQPVAAVRAAAFLNALCARYLPGVPPARLRTQPTAGGTPWQAPAVPALQADGENWSAFVAPDLAPIFADTPWLDVPPSPDGQADLLARLQRIKPEALDAALRSLPTATAPSTTPASAPEPLAPPTHGTPDVDPRQFLQRVLNDETAALALRIEAAKALLLHR